MNPIHARIRDAIAVGAIPREGLTQIVVEHGPKCGHGHNLATPCPCTPRITVATDTHVLSIGTGGAILERSPKQ